MKTVLIKVSILLFTRVNNVIGNAEIVGEDGIVDNFHGGVGVVKNVDDYYLKQASYYRWNKQLNNIKKCMKFENFQRICDIFLFVNPISLHLLWN